ncbi:MAG: tRNA lysidine(34) synthetase TilS [Actinobacteria bacterium]|nr:tRNA lysidine(34) synthetase TilS [Actinomycetota bacterium]MCA1720123.1 tRNA lysidine(34) synthetase TilS [Actinomycetota bacterium]
MLPPGTVAAAVSGGADSLALAAALAFERPGSFSLVVDHGLQEGSDVVAARAAEQCRGLGLEAQVLGPSRSSGTRTDPDADNAAKTMDGGPEAQARALRYRLLAGAADQLGLSAVLLGHTLDDQAETVLLGLARGSGARALAGMAASRDVFRRPLLGLSREVTAKACAEAALVPWEDPHNGDPRFARVRVRIRVLPVLEQELGPGIAEALARTAQQLREDADALDALTPDTADCVELAALPAALRSRAVKRWAEQACGRALTAAHVDALRALVEEWHGQGPVDLPGGVRVTRTGGSLSVLPA